MIVVDTNVIAYFVAQNDPVAELAEAVFRKDPEWAAPRLWRSELRNVLCLKIKQGVIDLAGAKVDVEFAVGLVAGREVEVDSARVLELAESSGCTAYDCEFVYVAETLNVPLITADKRVLAAFPGKAVSMTDFAA